MLLKEYYVSLCSRSSMLITVWKRLFVSSTLIRRLYDHCVYHVYLIGIESLSIVIFMSCFVGMIFTFQVTRELTYLGATNLVGSVLTVTFLRELSPVVTAIVVASRIGASYTAELAAMQVTNQVNVLYMLNVDPVQYLIYPRVIAAMLMLPILNLVSLSTTLASSLLIASGLYYIAPLTFLKSSFASFSVVDLILSLLKTVIFGLIIVNVSCIWGLHATGGSANVGKATTSSVVTILVIIFMSDFLLSLLMFHNSQSIFY
uniref:ABC transporter permease n=1 Tax=Yamadaella caenomyce TaxID=259029 RepID=A0A1G4NYL8_9FLOR|nr:Hypothetical protein ycf63 [Yamadaella caenomyce]SCW23735.1 Hypothetical protein ycf63 [Yamadaella caenomyce]